MDKNADKNSNASWWFWFHTEKNITLQI